MSNVKCGFLVQMNFNDLLFREKVNPFLLLCIICTYLAAGLFVLYVYCWKVARNKRMLSLWLNSELSRDSSYFPPVFFIHCSLCIYEAGSFYSIWDLNSFLSFYHFFFCSSWNIFNFLSDTSLYQVTSHLGNYFQ